jgi:hypothetical protein
MMRQIPHMVQDFKNSRKPDMRSEIFDILEDWKHLEKEVLGEEAAILEKAKIASAKKASEEKEVSDGDETHSKTKD